MADNEEAAAEDEGGKKKGGLVGKLLVWGVVFGLGIGTGVGVALMMAPAEDAEANAAVEPDVEKMDIPEADDAIGFIDFDEVVVNLNDPRYARYVTCTFSLQVAKSQVDAIQKLVDDKEPVLINWLIAHLRDKELDDVRAKLGHNTLRREIHDQFNKMLFTDGFERIQDVLFKDFKVQ